MERKKRETARSIAKAKGLLTYQGKACEACWSRRRYVSTRTCVVCNKARYSTLSSEGKAREFARLMEWKKRNDAAAQGHADAGIFDDLL